MSPKFGVPKISRANMLISLFVEKGLDKELAEMILQARDLGISFDEIREFLNQSQSLRPE